MAVESIAIGVGKVGKGWLTGSRPSRIRLAFRLSFSQACARICSACTEVRCAGVGRTAESQPLPPTGMLLLPPLPKAGASPRTFLFRLQLFKYVLIRFRARSANSGNCRLQESIIAWIFSFGCFDIGTILSRFSSTKRRTNILKAFSRSGS